MPAQDSKFIIANAAQTNSEDSIEGKWWLLGQKNALDDPGERIGVMVALLPSCSRTDKNFNNSFKRPDFPSNCYRNTPERGEFGIT